MWMTIRLTGAIAFWHLCICMRRIAGMKYKRNVRSVFNSYKIERLMNMPVISIKCEVKFHDINSFVHLHEQREYILWYRHSMTQLVHLHILEQSLIRFIILHECHKFIFGAVVCFACWSSVAWIYYYGDARTKWACTGLGLSHLCVWLKSHTSVCDAKIASTHSLVCSW